MLHQLLCQEISIIYLSIISIMNYLMYMYQTERNRHRRIRLQVRRSSFQISLFPISLFPHTIMEL